MNGRQNTWFEDIPSDWQRSRLKRFYSVRLGKMLQPSQTSPQDELIPYIRAANIHWEGPDISDIKEMWASPNEIRDGQLLPGDLLVSEGGDVGRSCLWNGDIARCIFQNAINRVRPLNKNLTGFLKYLMAAVKASGWIDILCNKATIAHFTAEKVNALAIPLPPPSVQHSITSYLDEQTAKIDRLMEMRRRQIALLKEQRAAMIQQAVTRGLNPNAPMKNSGIPWLGEIPAHWKIMALKFALAMQITDGPHETPELLPDGIPFLSAESVKGDRLDFNRKRGFISEKEHARFSKKYLPKRGDIFMVKSGATTGNVARVETDEVFNIWSPLAVLRPNPLQCTTDFLFYFMKSRSFLTSVEIAWSYGTQQNIGMGVVSNLRIALPAVEEQQEIARELNGKTKRIESLLERLSESIEKLLEYRAALIHECVTGQRILDETSIPEGVAS